MKRRVILGAALALPALRAAWAAPRLRVGSKNFTEQLVVAELFAQALEKAGAEVERRVNLGGTAIAHQALVSGEIDLYPEYTGTGLGVVLKQPPEGDAATVLRKVREGYEKQFGLTWLDPSGIDNGNALVVLPATARRYRLETLSDLARAAPQLTLAAGNEFADRRMGCPGCAGSMAWISAGSANSRRSACATPPCSMARRMW